jgi:hypothetical protein
VLLTQVKQACSRSESAAYVCVKDLDAIGTAPPGASEKGDEKMLFPQPVSTHI